MAGTALRTIAAAHAVLRQPAEADANFTASLATLEAIEHVPELARTRGIELLAACVAYEQRIGHAEAEEHAALVERLRQEGGA